jgi:LmbE family N-acetylglucosaminyl deacetylase
MTRRVLIVAPHPDDEVLGVGGTIARHVAEGAEVHVAIVTKGYAPDFDAGHVEQVRREAKEAHALLGTAGLHFLDLPAAALDTVPHREINARLGAVVSRVIPEVLYIPFNGDLHRDHLETFLSILVAARPNRSQAPRTIYAYETLSETNWGASYLMPGFAPNVFNDITDHLETKIRAMEVYQSQIKPFPNERSVESLRALAALRGSTVGVRAAEAFVLIRQVS